MGKRQLRIYQQDLVKQISSLLNKSVNIVLMNQTTIKGIIVKEINQTIIVKDHLQSSHVLPLHTIQEIIVDVVAAY